MRIDRIGARSRPNSVAGAKRLRWLCWTLLTLACSAIWGTHGATKASAEALIPVPETGAPGMVSLLSSVYPLTFPALNPGDSFSFQLGVNLSDASQGQGFLQLAATGSLAQAGGYSIHIAECDSLWQGSSGVSQSLTCETDSSNIISAQPITGVDQAIKLPLSDLKAGISRYLLVTLQRPAVATALPADPALNLGIGVFGFGDDPAAADEDRLATTGARLKPFLWGGGALLVAGVGVAAAHQRKGHSGWTSRN